jgi:NADH-quinone oxidoreductase subunit H
MLFMLGEYANIVLMCALTTILFFGGWLPPVDVAPSIGCRASSGSSLKVCFVFFMFAMVKAIVPRYRYDQLMRLGWKVFLPMSLGCWFVPFLAQARGPRLMTSSVPIRRTRRKPRD